MSEYGLYIITDERISGGLSHAEVAAQALEGGAEVIQLRDKDMSGGPMLAAALEIRELTRKAGALFIVNDRLDIALLSGADGVHLGQGDIPIAAARKLTPPGFIIGISVLTLEEALDAEASGADYLGPGPIFPTDTKLDAAPASGLDSLREMSSKVSIPLVAIGGINHQNLADVIKAGASGAAIISAAVAAPDIMASCKELGIIITQARKER